MPRAPRLIPFEGLLHVISRGNNRRRLFFRQSDFRAYYLQLKELKVEESIQIFHYCLMPNHIHLLVGVGENSDLSRFMKRLNLKYFYHYRKKHKYIGHLWQDRFKSKIIERDGYLMVCGTYIELNPVRAGLVEKPEDYPYSSRIHYALGLKDDIVDEDPLYKGLGRDPQERQYVYRKMLEGEIARRKASAMQLEKALSNLVE